MKKQVSILKLLGVFFLVCMVILSQNCKQKSAGENALEAKAGAALEINVQEIKDSTGIEFSISKTKDIGYKPLHKFLWVGLEQKINQEKLKQLAQEIIKGTIAKKPETYHSFTIHFICEDENTKSKRQPEAYAKVTFLPEGDWVKVGRAPIDDYAGYKLTCTIKDNMLK
jgi:p-aminobenzoyl-glutamate transporter AbgT